MRVVSAPHAGLRWRVPDAGLLWVLAILAGAAGVAAMTSIGGGSTLSAPFLLTSDERSANPHAADERAGGWVLSVTDASGKCVAQSGANFASFALKPGETLDPQIAPAGFTAVYETTIAIDDQNVGSYRFGMDVEGGEATIRVFAEGKEVAKAAGSGVARGGAAAGVVSPWVQIGESMLSVSVRFARKGDAPVRLRVVWERQWQRELRPGVRQGFRAEPIPLTMTKPAGTASEALKTSHLAQTGRAMLGTMGCANCHALDDKAAAVVARKGPLLGDIARRATAGWMLRWIANPQTIKPGSHMPNLIGDAPKDIADAANITHYLLSLGPGDLAPPVPLVTDEHAHESGRTLFHTLGCVACHSAFESAKAVFGVASMPDVVPKEDVPEAYGKLAGKWRPEALRDFLLDPRKVHPTGRMPSMGLNEEQADFLTRYLIAQWDKAAGGKPHAQPTKFIVDPARAQLGKASFASRGCASCHEMWGGGVGDPIVSKLSTKPMKDLILGQGCLDANSTTAPRYTLTANDRKALAAGIESVKKAGAASAPIDRQAQTIYALNCLACHAKDGEGGVAGGGEGIDPYFRNTDEKAELGDEGRIPPNLTHVGWKLTTPWLRKMLLEAGRARPYMSTRMPQFGEANVGSLVDELAAHDGVWPDKDIEEPKPEGDMVLAGRTLIGEKGLNCLSCHVFGDAAPTGTAGPDITRFASRLRYDWWRSYVLTPKRFKPDTRMSEFFLNGRSSVTTVLGGDHEKQTDALWSYFQLGKLAPSPDGLTVKGSMTLRVGDKPVVFRSFLEHAGSRGVAVGFPIGLHFAFDADTCRLVEAWQGDFIDATGAWKSRGGSVTGGNGKPVWTAPVGPSVVVGPQPAEWPKVPGVEAVVQFKGYELNLQGVPTFNYTIDAGVRKIVVHERFEPTGSKTLLIGRTFKIEGAKGLELWINGGKGKVTATGQSELVQKNNETWVKVVVVQDTVEIAMGITP